MLRLRKIRGRAREVPHAAAGGCGVVHLSAISVLPAVEPPAGLSASASASASSAICRSTWPWTPPTSGPSRRCFQLDEPVRSDGGGRRAAGLLQPPTASFGAIPSTDWDAHEARTASAGGSAASTAPASCMMSSASTTSAGFASVLGRALRSRRRPRTAAGSRGRAWI